MQGASFGGRRLANSISAHLAPGNFLTRATTIAATLFFVTSLALAIFARENAGVGRGFRIASGKSGFVGRGTSPRPARFTYQVDDSDVPTVIDGDLPKPPSGQRSESAVIRAFRSCRSGGIGRHAILRG